MEKFLDVDDFENVITNFIIDWYIYDEKDYWVEVGDSIISQYFGYEIFAIDRDKVLILPSDIARKTCKR